MWITKREDRRCRIEQMFSSKPGSHLQNYSITIATYCYTYVVMFVLCCYVVHTQASLTTDMKYQHGPFPRCFVVMPVVWTRCLLCDTLPAHVNAGFRRTVRIRSLRSVTCDTSVFLIFFPPKIVRFSNICFLICTMKQEQLSRKQCFITSFSQQLFPHFAVALVFIFSLCVLLPQTPPDTIGL